MLSSPSLAEECVEGIVTSTDALVTRHLTIGLNSMLQAVQLPTGVAHLDARLTNMDAETFTLNSKQKQFVYV